MKYSALIVAAGSGSRMNLGYNKVYAKLEDGRTILETTISVFMEDPDCAQIVVVSDPAEFRSRYHGRMPGKITMVCGGVTRQESVRNGLCCVISDMVMIHDGARPYINADELDRLKETMESEKAALLVVPCKDTIKKVENGYIKETYDRSKLIAAQTPQCFETNLIISCMEKAMMEHFTGTDDASLVEKYSTVRVKAVPGDYSNYKITTIEDLKR